LNSQLNNFYRDIDLVSQYDHNTMTDYETQRKQMVEYYENKTDTPKPCNVGDTVEVTQISGIPSHMTDYPVTGEVTRVEPKGVGTHNIMADWFIRVHFTEEQLDGAVFKGTTELYCIGGTRKSWDESPIEIVDQ